MKESDVSSMVCEPGDACMSAKAANPLDFTKIPDDSTQTYDVDSLLLGTGSHLKD